jgi:polyhydroxyalkanoate synthase
LLNRRWWEAATAGLPGVSRHHEAVVSFIAQQMLDVVSPANFVATAFGVNNDSGRTGQNLV